MRFQTIDIRAHNLNSKGSVTGKVLYGFKAPHVGDKTLPIGLGSLALKII